MNAEALTHVLPRLPEYFANHVLLTIGALCIGLLVSLPLAILALRHRALAGPLLGVASVIQTIPGLALLALMVPLLGRIGVVPALVALVLYSMLPILRNTVTGALAVDPDVIDAARGIGMTDDQILARVQLPLAAPMIVAGIRTAAVWTVGMATLSTPVGASSLGNLIFSGLQTRNTSAVLLGCLCAAALAIALDSLIRLGEIAAERRKPLLGLVVVATLLLGTAVAAWPRGSSADRAVAPPVVVGAKTFTEQYILSQLIRERLEARGLTVEARDSLGSTVVFEALASNEIDVYVDYTGTIWANHMKRADTPSAAVVMAQMDEWLGEQHGVVDLGALGFENAYALAMRRDRAKALGIETLHDLAQRSPEISIGADYEFLTRPEWIAVRDRYGFRFGEARSFDSSLMYDAVADRHVDVISAFSTDGRIAAFDLFIVDDPLEAFPPYDAVLLLSPRAALRPDVVEALAGIIGRIDDDLMRRANKAVDLDKRGITEAAALIAEELGE